MSTSTDSAHSDGRPVQTGDPVITTYWMDGLLFARHSSHADYATKEQLAPEVLKTIVVCMTVTKAGLVFVAAGEGRHAARKACIQQVENASGSSPPPQGQGEQQEQDHG